MIELGFLDAQKFFENSSVLLKESNFALLPIPERRLVDP